jgi:hypothetical protein
VTWQGNGTKTALRDIWVCDKLTEPSSRFDIRRVYRWFRIWGSYFIEEPRGEGLYLTDPRTGRRSDLIKDSDHLAKALLAYWHDGAREVSLSFPPPESTYKQNAISSISANATGFITAPKPVPLQNSVQQLRKPASGASAPLPNKRTRNSDESSQDCKRGRVTKSSKRKTHKEQSVAAEVSDRFQPAASASGTVHRERDDSRIVSAAVSAPAPKEQSAAQRLDVTQTRTLEKPSVDQPRLVQDNNSPLIHTSAIQDLACTKQRTTPHRPTPSPITSPTPSSSLRKDASKLTAAVQAVSSSGSRSSTRV